VHEVVDGPRARLRGEWEALRSVVGWMLVAEPVRRPVAVECVVEAGRLLRETIEATPVEEWVEVEEGGGGGDGGNDDGVQAKRKREASEQEPEGFKKQRQASADGQGPVNKEG
jgi:hypothetical protein